MVFIHSLSRRVFVSRSTFETSPTWMAQQAQAFVAHARSIGLPAGLQFRDRDKKFRAVEFEGELRQAVYRRRRRKGRCCAATGWAVCCATTSERPRDRSPRSKLS
jgi:hypothetical protein